MKNKRKAFSVAEATIALLIGSIALGMAAPMITKQIKAQNMTDTQYRLINSSNEDLRSALNNANDLISELFNRIETLENENNDNSPSGMIAFFNTETCPDGWSQLNNDYNGRYFKVAGNYTICDKEGENRDGSCKGRAVTTVTDNYAGVFSGDAIRNITGQFTAYELGRNTSQNYAIGAFDVDATSTLARGSSSHAEYAPLFIFNAGRVVPTEQENRPRSVSMLACVRR